MKLNFYHLNTATRVVDIGLAICWHTPILRSKFYEDISQVLASGY